MELSRRSISFLRDALDIFHQRLDLTSGWRYRYFEGLSVSELSTFIKLIEDNKILLIIPVFSGSKSLSSPALNLSEPFLIDNKSNPILITKFIVDQWNASGFEIKLDTKISFYFKFKRVWFID